MKTAVFGRWGVEVRCTLVSSTSKHSYVCVTIRFLRDIYAEYRGCPCKGEGVVVLTPYSSSLTLR